MKRILWCMVFALCFCMLLPIMPAEAAVTGMAKDISSSGLFTQINGLGSGEWLFDGAQGGCVKVGGNSSFTLEDDRGIGSLYFVFDMEYGNYTLTNNDTGEVMTLGTYGFLHEFVEMKEAATSVTVTFDNGPVELNEMYVFTEGEVPAHIQKWQPPKEGGTDLVLFSTHGDDEHLFFAGILPYYAAELDYQVQVVYLTNHRNLTKERCHEMLNGLWAVGMDTYPVFGNFPDYFCRNMADSYTIYSQQGVTEEELLAFVVEQMRRFKPKVAVGHDPINGEYRHGMHMMYADLMMKALEITDDPQQFPESAETYGTWDVPKTYLHLYPENPIVMDWDQSLSRFYGMTAYEVSKDLGFTCHVSQYLDFAWYIAGMDTAAQIPNYNPREYGLYRSTVGADVQKNDFFENVTTYAQDAAKQAEEDAWLADMQRAEEEARRIEEARVREEAENREETEPMTDASETGDPLVLACWVTIVLTLLVFVAFCVRKRRGK